MKRNNYTKSIGFNILVSFLVVIFCITVVISTVSYVFTLRLVEEAAVKSTGEMVAQIGRDIENYVLYMENIADFVITDYDTKQYMYEATTEDRLLRVSQKLNTILNVRSDISNILLFKNDGTTAFCKDYLRLNPNVDYMQKDWYVNAVNAGGRPVISSSHVQNVIFDDYRWVISMSKAVMDNHGECVGVLLIDLRYDAIKSLCENITLGGNGYVFVLDNAGGMVYHPFQQLIYSNIKQEAINEIALNNSLNFTFKDPYNGKSYTVATFEKTGWKVAGAYDVKELLTDRGMIALWYLYIFVIFSCIGAILSVMLSNKLTLPIKHLIQGMRRVETGDFTSKVNITTQDEIGHLAHVFNIMVEHINELISSGKKDLEDKRKSEIKALQAQINPHFLYNTLDSIVWMAEAGETEEVVEMTMALSGLFRTSISKSDELVPLALEIENIKAYLTIQQIRYKNSISYEINIPDELMQCKVIKLFLQPIVENAIYHGIKEKDGGGLIKIMGYDAGSDFIISVGDTGVGMTEEALETILQPKDTSTGGIGVVNVNERIKLYFGDAYGLNYQSRQGEGTLVIILLPKIEEDTL